MAVALPCHTESSATAHCPVCLTCFPGCLDPGAADAHAAIVSSAPAVPLLCAVAPLQAMLGQDVATLCAGVASVASSLATLPAEVDPEPSLPLLCFVSVKKKTSAALSL
jgi:hypothetical protein